MLTVRHDFVDRIAEIERLNMALQDEGFDKNSFVLIHGQSGIGKTQLLAKFLRISKFNDLSIAYIDLPDKDYLGLIDKIAEELGPNGFEALDEAYDEVILRSQIVRGQSVLSALSERQPPGSDTSSQGFIFENTVTAETQYFINGNVTFRNPKITNVYNLVLDEPEQVRNLSQRKITQAFYRCLRTITQERVVAILLDHWEHASDPLKKWVTDHLIPWASEFSLKKALVVLCREDIPKEWEHQTGIMTLALPEFTKEIALEYWIKCGFLEHDFESVDLERCKIPRMLALEIDRRRELRRDGK